MKWLIAFPDDGETNDAIAEGCRVQGIEYDTIDARRHPEHMYAKMCSSKGKYDAVLMSRTLELYAGLVRCKNQFPDVKYMCWNPDARKDLEMWGPLLDMFSELDYYFMMDKSDLPEMRKKQPNTYYLPQGIHSERYHAVALTMDDHAKYDCDISFIGSIIPSIHVERAEVFNALEDSPFDFKVFNNVWGDEHNKVVMCSKINLSCEHSPEKAGYFSVRNYKIIACGGIVLDLFHEDLDVLFGDACHYFTTPIGAVQKVAEILGNYKEFKAKAESYREWSLDAHTYAERIGRIRGLLETGEFKEY